MYKQFMSHFTDDVKNALEDEGIKVKALHLSKVRKVNESYDAITVEMPESKSSGDISLKNVISTEKISVERSTGDVTLDRSDAAELFIMTSTGDVEGSLLTNKVFITKTDTGRIDVPNSIIGGRCEITTDTGDIKISILED